MIKSINDLAGKEITLFRTKKGKYTLRPSEDGEEVVILGNEHFARDQNPRSIGPAMFGPILWATLNKKTGKMQRLFESRAKARAARKPNETVVALG